MVSPHVSSWLGEPLGQLRRSARSVEQTKGEREREGQVEGDRKRELGGREVEENKKGSKQRREKSGQEQGIRERRT